jgi:dolichol-phosphate mannosyltransferase
MGRSGAGLSGPALVDDPQEVETTYIVVPTLNERPNLEPLVHSIQRAMQGEDFRILIVDDGSTDGTRELAELLRGRGFPLSVLDRGSKRGIGSAIRDGLSWCLAQGDVGRIVTMDADMSHDPRDLPRLLSVAPRADLVQGSRYVEEGSVGRWSTSRWILSIAANTAVRLLLKTGMREHTTYFRVYSPRAAYFAASVADANGYEWAVGSLSAILAESLRVEEVPIHFEPRKEGSSKMTPAALFQWARYVARQALALNRRQEDLIRISRFALVGLIGLLLNQTILFALHGVGGQPPVVAALIAIEISVLSNFVINDRWTFGDRGGTRSALNRLVRYHGACLVGILANVSLFSLLVLGFGTHYLIASSLGILVGFVANFHGSSVWTWVKS